MRMNKRKGGWRAFRIVFLGVFISLFGMDLKAEFRQVVPNFPVHIDFPGNLKLPFPDGKIQVVCLKPKIRSIDPERAMVDDTVVIEGCGFSSVPEENIVTFNGVESLPPSEATRKSLTVEVPEGATSGFVEVTVGDKTSNGVFFTVYHAPTQIEARYGEDNDFGIFLSSDGETKTLADGLPLPQFPGSGSPDAAPHTDSILILMQKDPTFEIDFTDQLSQFDPEVEITYAEIEVRYADLNHEGAYLLIDGEELTLTGEPGELRLELTPSPEEDGPIAQTAYLEINEHYFPLLRDGHLDVTIVFPEEEQTVSIDSLKLTVIPAEAGTPIINEAGFTPLSGIETEETLGAVAPTGITFSEANGSLYLADPDSRIIFELTSLGEVWTYDLTSLGIRPDAIAYHPTRQTVFVSDALDDYITEVVLDHSSGEATVEVQAVLDVWEFDLGSVVGLEVDPFSGNLWLIDSTSKIFREISPDGDQIVRDVRPQGVAPFDIVIPAQDTFYVTGQEAGGGYSSTKLWEYDASGALIAEYDWSSWQFSPKGIAFDSDTGYLYAVGQFQDRGAVFILEKDTTE